MNQKEYAQVYELGLGSLVGDFFQNVKDTVTGVAKAVAPIAPYVLPFIAPGIGSLVGGSLGSFLASKGGQYLLGAGITFATLGVFYYWKVDKPDTNDGSPLSTAIVESITKRDQVQTITENFTIFGGTVSFLTKTTTTVIRDL